MTTRRNPVEPLSKDSHAFMHKPFDVSEVRCQHLRIIVLLLVLACQLIIAVLLLSGLSWLCVCVCLLAWHEDSVYQL